VADSAGLLNRCRDQNPYRGFESRPLRLCLMDTSTPTPGYSHTQKGPLCWILYGPALVCFAFAIGMPTVQQFPGKLIAFAIGVVLVLVGMCFHHLTVEDRGDFLSIRFGLIPLFRRKLWYADIAKVEVGRTIILDGWGIHYSRGGWVWNLWGWDCVLVYFDKSKLRIGTDDAANLCRFLNDKANQGKT
jgi:hypothetical protein